ncbi:unnamed protein product [Kuraishia capsulata CBS 1993]|uniref:Threonylcarbamoyl-AMP synthase n=1 Tax=Kuraishia capsulata CBS 1993 TaxID=1382522 RepID=W6MNK9_9ASCO|nr:uncharacterized protein KUCA_T00004236001 [Kuraishia capsulata CBS 1993]CDK28254.1 unnamed protein product [Kuraishia capsulata CBS 1993]
MLSLLARRFYSKMSTQVLKVDPQTISFKDGVLKITDPETAKNLRFASELLIHSHEAIAFPTETVYGLGGSCLVDESVQAIYKAKNRPSDNPLISHVSSVQMIYDKFFPGQNYQIPEIYQPLIDKFWPGPLTILLPVLPGCPISKYVTADQPTFAVRMPAHPVARALIEMSDVPLAAPSANASTRPSPTLASHVYTDLHGRIPLILDGGVCDVGLESTVVDGLTSPPMLLRPGGVSLEQIRAAGGDQWKDVVIAKKTAGKLEPVRTPGMKYRHYSPTAKVVLFNNCGDGIEATGNYLQELEASTRIALLRSRRFAPPSDKRVTAIENLGTTGDDIQRNLFALLRKADETGVDYIFVEGIDESDEGLAIMNRLSKAAYATVDGDTTL